MSTDTNEPANSNTAAMPDASEDAPHEFDCECDKCLQDYADDAMSRRVEWYL